MEDKKEIGNCEVCGDPIYEGDAYITDHDKLYKPEHYEDRVVDNRSIVKKLFTRGK